MTRDPPRPPGSEPHDGGDPAETLVPFECNRPGTVRRHCSGVFLSRSRRVVVGTIPRRSGELRGDPTQEAQSRGQHGGEGPYGSPGIRKEGSPICGFSERG